MIRIVSPWRFLTFITAVLLLLSLGIWWLLWGGGTILRSGEITVSSGEKAAQVWQDLVAQHFTRQTLPWRYYSSKLHVGSGIKAGVYKLTRGESVVDVIRRMLAGEVVSKEKTITFPEGFTLAQMASRTAVAGLGTKEDFVKAATPADFVQEFPWLKDVPSGRTLEGYLFPDTYRVFPDDKPRDLIHRMLANFNTKMMDSIQANKTTNKRTLDQIVIMASIIEREVTRNEDMTKVSDVLWKRLDSGQGLAVDSSVRYITGNWTDPLTVKDLAIDSPYNTRKYKGLPPGPISNPGIRALTAAANPEANDYYYYLSTPSGETIFAKTNDEHNKNKAKYLK